MTKITQKITANYFACVLNNTMRMSLSFTPWEWLLSHLGSDGERAVSFLSAQLTTLIFHSLWPISWKPVSPNHCTLVSHHSHLVRMCPVPCWPATVGWSSWRPRQLRRRGESVSPSLTPTGILSPPALRFPVLWTGGRAWERRAGRTDCSSFYKLRSPNWVALLLFDRLVIHLLIFGIIDISFILINSMLFFMQEIIFFKAFLICGRVTKSCRRSLSLTLVSCVESWLWIFEGNIAKQHL